MKLAPGYRMSPVSIDLDHGEQRYRSISERVPEFSGADNFRLIDRNQSIPTSGDSSEQWDRHELERSQMDSVGHEISRIC